MPNGEFESQLTKWQEQFNIYQTKSTAIQNQIGELTRAYEQQVVTTQQFEQMPLLERAKFKITHPFWYAAPVKETRDYKLQVSQTLLEMERNDFLARLYGQVPGMLQTQVILKSAGRPVKAELSTVEDVLATLKPPDNLTSEELESAKTAIGEMIGVITGTRPLPEMAEDMPEITPPELVPPTEVGIEVGTPVALNLLTVDEIIKALQSSVEVPPPSPILSEEEWRQYLLSSGYDPDDPDLDYIQSESERLIAEWKERDSQITAFKEGVATMPDYTLIDILKESIIQPGLGLMELANIYFEHVSQPLAGLLYKTFVPDIEKKYQEYKQTESTWKALAHSWQEWDAPGEGAWEWILKYMIMEGIADPLSYVGWGIATKITRPLGGFGRLVGAAERGFMQVMNLPFDMLKAGLNRLPKSLSQRAAISEAKAVQFVDKWVTSQTGKSIRDLTASPDGMVQFNKAIGQAVKAAGRNPNLDTDIVRAGKELLKHTPVNEKIVLDWSSRLSEIAKRPSFLTTENVTKELVENIDNLFEDFFMRGGVGKQKITIGEAASRLLDILGVTKTDDNWKLAQRILDERATQIVNNGLAIGAAASPIKALYALGRRNFRIHMLTEESAAYLARKQAGAFAKIGESVSLRVQQVWRNGIDRWVVRPFAEAYLAFALYGPMNIVEDMWRSIIGGVIPNRTSGIRFARKWVGVGYDSNLMRDAMSETLGELRRAPEAAQTNWILSLGGLSKGFGEKTYGVLVEKPGQIGLDFRRGFVDGRATQILKENGGEAFEKLVKIDSPAPKLTNKKLVKEITETVNDLKLSGDPDAIRYAKELYTKEKILRREIDNVLMEHPDMPRVFRDKVLKDMDDNILINNPEQIDLRMGEGRDVIMDDFIRSPERASEQMKQLADFLTDLEVKNPEEMAQVMSSLNYMAQVYGATPKQVMKRVTQRTRGLPFAERSASINADMDRLSIFLERSADDMKRVAEKIKTELPTSGVSPELATAYDRYYDTLMAKSINASDNRMADMARRREYFAEVTAKDLGDPDFWERFYLETDAFWEKFDLEQLDFDSLLNQIAKEQSQIMGVQYPTRAPIKITDRPLAPQDIATILNCRTDDISKELMSSLALRQDRPRFVKYVMQHVTPDDVGVTPEAVGQAYDQIIYSLQADPRTLDWITPRLKELEVIRRDLHSLYNSKLLPEGEIAEIGRYVDDIANKVEDIVYEVELKPFQILESNVLPENVLYHGTYSVKAADAIQSEGFKLGQSQYGFKEGALGRGVYFYKTRQEYNLAKDFYPYDYLVTASAKPGTKIKRLDLSQFDIGERSADVKKLVGAAKVEGYDGVELLFSNIKALSERQRFKIWAGDQVIIFDPNNVNVIVPKISYRGKPTKPEFAEYNNLRQKAMDEAHKWYYKEFTDYTHGNVFDSMMKSIYPYWTYESQRWMWLPRSFMTHPGTFTSYERWQNNSDQGSVHIFGIPIDINPFRGNVYGTLTTRLARRDFPEYYDSLGIAGDFVEFMDFLSRYGFYPGAHIGIPLAMFGGIEMQFGEVMPAIPRTGLDILMAIFPDNESVRWITDHVFGDRFRNYLTILQVNRRGGDGTLIFSKSQEGEKLTPGEQQLWDDARREVGWYSAGFEQFGMFRMRTDEQYKMYEEAGKVIEQMTGYTPEQQDWLRKHGYRLWDMVGGMSRTEQAVLQQLDYYRWVGNVRPLLPGRQQTILNRVELAWDDVKKYSESLLVDKVQLQKDFLAGVMGSDDYNASLVAIYTKQREYIYNKMVDELPIPIPPDLSENEKRKWVESNTLMTLDGRTTYNKEENVVMPVMHPMNELLNLYFDTPLEEIIDPETGEKVKDWDKFWAMRDIIEKSIPDEYKEEWQDYLSRNSSSLEQIRRIHNNYIKPYNRLWERILGEYTPEEQRLIKEHQHLLNTGTGLARRAEIEDITRPNDRKLIANYRSDISEARRALRYANPYLDATLYYWGRTTTFMTPEGEEAYIQLCKDTGKKI